MTLMSDSKPSDAKPASTPDKEVASTGSARSVLVTVLGELVEPYGQPVRTAALLYVLKGLGYGEHAARQAIAPPVLVTVNPSPLRSMAFTFSP